MFSEQCERLITPSAESLQSQCRYAAVWSGYVSAAEGETLSEEAAAQRLVAALRGSNSAAGRTSMSRAALAQAAIAGRAILTCGYKTEEQLARLSFEDQRGVLLDEACRRTSPRGATNARAYYEPMTNAQLARVCLLNTPVRWPSSPAPAENCSLPSDTDYSRRLFQVSGRVEIYVSDYVDGRMVCRHIVEGSVIDSSGGLFQWNQVQQVATLPHPIGPTFTAPPTRATQSHVRHEQWMEDCWSIIADKPLLQLCLPGTHDSGTYNLDKDKVAPDADGAVPTLMQIPNEISGVHDYIKAMAVTQHRTIRGQLDDGIRYIDLRVCEVNGKLHTCHSLLGDELSVLLSDMRAFLDAHPREFILVKTGFKKMDGSGQQARALAEIARLLGEHFTHPDTGLNFAALTPRRIVTVLGGRCIFLWEDDSLMGIYSEDAWTKGRVDALLKSETSRMVFRRAWSWDERRACLGVAGREGDHLNIPASHPLTLRYGTLDLTGDHVVKPDVRGDVVVGLSLFGRDPAYGKEKATMISTDPGSLHLANGWGWLPVADEGESFATPAKQTYRYGAPSGRWNHKEAENTIHFANNVFNDPCPGIVKQGQVRFSDFRLTEAQLFRPINIMRYVLGYVRTLGGVAVGGASLAVLGTLPLLGPAIPFIAPLVATVMADTTNPTSLHQNAQGSRTILRDYVRWLKSGAVETPEPQLIICDFANEVPLVDVAILLSCGKLHSTRMAAVLDSISDLNDTDGGGPALQMIEAAIKTAEFFKNVGRFFSRDVPQFFENDFKNFFVHDVNNFFVRDVGGAFETAGQGIKETAETVGEGIKDAGETVGNTLNPSNW